MTEADESTTGSPPVTPGQPGLSPDVLKVLEQLGVNPESATVTTSADGSTTVTTVTHNVINSFEPGKLASTGAAEGELEEHIQAANYELLAEGVEAEATLLEVSELGVSAGTDNPGLSLQLLVRPEGREAFQAQATCFVSRKAVRKFRPGGTVIVKFDPSNTTRVAVARSGPEEQEPLVIE